MTLHTASNLIDAVIDEVALEGLDGITLEALWLRLSNRLHIPLPFPRTLMVEIWSICIKVPGFAFYELETPRKQLVIYDRYEYVESELGIICEPDNLPEDIYPHCPINDPVTHERGSCSSYKTRKNISDVVKNYELDQSEKYGQKLVIVASQIIREHALVGDEVLPTLDLNPVQYYFLERVGRSRYLGEVTQGRLSLNALNEDAKALFYHRKLLLRHKLITKQIHHQKCLGHSSSGSLVHLTRFYIERKSKIISLTEQIIEILKTKENYAADYNELKKILKIGNSIKCLFKTSFFQKVMKTDLRVPYRTAYPNATSNEWQHKNNPSKEKTIRVVQLLDPNVDLDEIWNKEESHEDDVIVPEVDVSHHKLNSPFLKQVNKKIEESKRSGICQMELAASVGLTKLQSRAILRNLVKKSIVATYMSDMGRQRLIKYVSKKFEESSEMSQQFNQEIHKIMEHSKDMIIENPKKTEKCKANVEQEILTQNDKKPIESTIEQVETNTDVDTHCVTTDFELNKFYTVNRILCKYGITKHPSRYKRTSLNLHKEMDQISTQNKISNKPVFSGSRLSDNLKVTSLYNNIKTNLTMNPNSNKKPSDKLVGFMQDIQDMRKNKKSKVTYRLLRRANIIIESVKEHRVIDDITKLMRMISRKEKKEGYGVKIDKKSMVRLLQRLARDNLVKTIRVTLSSQDRQKSLTFVCDPNIDIDHTVIKSAVEQAEVKFCLSGVQDANVSSKYQINKFDKTNSSDIPKTIKESVSKQEHNVPKCDPRIGKKYGYSPKFVRMKVLHILLYYLVYENLPDQKIIPKEEHIDYLRRNGFNITDSIAKEMNTIYSTEVGWKMFIPPLPRHDGWSLGWTLMSDVLLRLPLSIFVKLHNIKYVLPELENYLNHPIRKHYLVKDIPLEIRNTLFLARKYIFDIHQTISHLCYIGLVQFGPQKLKEKDQVFIYINKHTQLLDTLSSSPSYHKIENKEYPVIEYTFDQLSTVEKYWYDMWNICVNTPLGGRLAVQGKDIVLEDLSRKTEMIEAIRPRTAQKAIDSDVGYVPGDHQGAAGIDSAFFAHLKRNWNWSSVGRSTVNKTQEKTMEKTVSVPRKKSNENAKLEEQLHESPKDNSRAVTNIKKRQKDSQKLKKHEILTPYQVKQKSFVRTVMPRKTMRRARVKYDETDYRALQRMHKLRVDWEPQEDNVLLVCKVAMTYLCPNYRKQLISFTSVRDVLRSYCHNSCNKTSKACQRRLLYMLKQPQTVKSVMLGVEELKQNFFVNARFGGIVDKIEKQYKNPHECEKRIAEVFENLVKYIASRYYDISQRGMKELFLVPKTIQEFNIFYKIIHATKAFENLGFTNDIRNLNDIYCAALNSVIHSSMCCKKDKRSWTYQFFKVYQQYPETLLRMAMTKMRSDQVVTIKKKNVYSSKKYGNYVPMSSSQYELSTSYVYKFQNKWPFYVYEESYDAFNKLLEQYAEKDTIPDTEILNVTGGIVVAMQDYIAQNQLEFDVEIPNQVITLDPRLKEKDEIYVRIAKRYQDILASFWQHYCHTEKNINLENNTEVSITETCQDKDINPLKNIEEIEDRSSENNKRNESDVAQYKPSMLIDKAPCDSFNKSFKRKIDQKEEINLDEPGIKRIKLQEESIASGNFEEESNKDIEKEIELSTDSSNLEIKTKIMERNEGANTQKMLCSGVSAASREDVYTRVNDILKNVCSEITNVPTCNRTDDTNDIRKKQTRLDLLKMREELNDLSITESHRAHEYFVINMFKIRYSLRSDPSRTEQTENFNNPVEYNELLSVTLSNIDRLINKLNKFIHFPKIVDIQLNYEDSTLLGTINRKKIDALYKYVKEHKEFGVTLQELVENFKSELTKNDLNQILTFMTENKIFLRTGVTTIRYVHYNYADAWLVNSCKLYRSERESLEPIPKKRIYMLTKVDGKETKDEISKTEKNNENNCTVSQDISSVENVLLSQANKESSKEETQDKNNECQNSLNTNLSSESDNEGIASIKNRMKRKRSYLLTRKDISKAVKQLDSTTAEQIRVAMKPWIRVDGVLNRKVLDRMLGAVLTYCLTNPGVTLNNVQRRFTPLQPTHVYELIEMLIELGCVKMQVFQKTKVTLFSKPSVIKPTEDKIWSNSEEVFIEPLVGATSKFGIYLSTRNYTSYFIP